MNKLARTKTARIRPWLGALIGCVPLLACGTDDNTNKPGKDKADASRSTTSNDADASNTALATNTVTSTQTSTRGDGNLDASTDVNPNTTTGEPLDTSEPTSDAPLETNDGGAPSDASTNQTSSPDASNASDEHSTTSGGNAVTSDEQMSDDGVEVELVVSSVVEKVDMLFVVDNSMSMADKQAILQEALPDLMERFVNPVCVDTDGNEVERPNGVTTCPAGSAPEFNPVRDINIGIITSSLGGVGSDTDCLKDERGGTFDQSADMARLVGSLNRGADMGGDFLQWRSQDSELSTFMQDFTDQVGAVGEFGCGFEATMESWVRFLVDPYPYQEAVRAPCNENDTFNSCGKPKTDDQGEVLIDDVLLEQRSRFLRMDSLLAVIMLSDENDCSFKVGGQQVLLADTQAGDGRQSTTYRASAACATDPNDPCCHSCGVTPPSGCDGEGCEDLFYPEPSNVPGEFFEDQINLRCYKQKQRFGLDFLYPVERYANALSLDRICPTAPDLKPDTCEPELVVDNPVFTATVNGEVVTRPKSLVFLAGIVGVPWQDVAHDPTGEQPLKYKKALDPSGAATIDWDMLLGQVVDQNKPAGVLKRGLYPTLESGIDPLMFESVQPREGVNPATNEPLASPSAELMANSINGHEWNPLEGVDLQYACIFELDEPVPCPTLIEQLDEEELQGTRLPTCACTITPNEDGLEYNSPLCQSENGYDMTQRYAKAYPGIRELQALELFSELNPQKNAIVASICPKESEDPELPDFGYRPAVASIVDRLKEQLQARCLPRPLSVTEEGDPACVIVEASFEQGACDGAFRQPVDELTASAVRRTLEDDAYCTDDECDAFNLCVVPHITQSDDNYEACLSGTNGDGWCYVDQAHYEGEEVPTAIANALESCPTTAKRKLSFSGQGRLSAPTSLAFYVCVSEP